MVTPQNQGFNLVFLYFYQQKHAILFGCIEKMQNFTRGGASFYSGFTGGKTDEQRKKHLSGCLRGIYTKFELRVGYFTGYYW